MNATMRAKRWLSLMLVFCMLAAMNIAYAPPVYAAASVTLKGLTPGYYYTIYNDSGTKAAATAVQAGKDGTGTVSLSTVPKTIIAEGRASSDTSGEVKELVLNLMEGGNVSRTFNAGTRTILLLNKAMVTLGATTSGITYKDGAATAANSAGYVVLGTGEQTANQLSCTTSADVVLCNVNSSINGVAPIQLPAGSNSEVTLTLLGENKVNSKKKYTPAVAVPKGCSLTINGSNADSLTATVTKGYAACIGGTGGNASTAGNITINGGKITAMHGAGDTDFYGAGIGGGENGGFSTITINGGVIYASGGSGSSAGAWSGGAGIGTGGGGSSNAPAPTHHTGKIIVNGGTIVATGGAQSVAGTHALTVRGMGIGNAAARPSETGGPTNTPAAVYLQINGGSIFSEETEYVSYDVISNHTGARTLREVVLDAGTANAEVLVIRGHRRWISTTNGNGKVRIFKPTEESAKTQELLPEWSAEADTSWYNANDNTFFLSTAEQMAGLAKLVNGGNDFAGKTIELTNDINLADKNWTPIGCPTNVYATTGRFFAGKFNGNFNKISGLNSNGYQRQTNGSWQFTSGVGLFGVIAQTAELCNLEVSVDMLYTNAQGNGVGGISGFISGKTADLPPAGNIHDCTVTVKEDGIIDSFANNTHVASGGMVGCAWGGTIRDCFVDVLEGAVIGGETINGQLNVGGYIAFAGVRPETNDTPPFIERCRSYVAGTLQGVNRSSTSFSGSGIGGFIGYGSKGCGIKDSYALITTGGALRLEITNVGGETGRGCGGLVGIYTSGTSEKPNKISTSYVLNEGKNNISVAASSSFKSIGLLIGQGSGANDVLKNCYGYQAAGGTTLPLYGKSESVTTEASEIFTTRTDMKTEAKFTGFDFNTVWMMDTVKGCPKMQKEPGKTDAYAVASIMTSYRNQYFTFDAVKGTNLGEDRVCSDLSLLASGTIGFDGVLLTWTSSDESVVSVAGGALGKVIQPTDADKNVTLTAILSKGEASTSAAIQMTVKKAHPVDWSDFWSGYWQGHDDITWATVGDSITFNYMGHTKGYRNYYEWLQYRLNAELGKQVKIVDPAWNGKNLDYFNDNVDDGVNKYEADLVTVYFGMNDRFTLLETSKAELLAMMEKLMPSKENQSNRGTPADRVIVLISCQPTKNGTDENNLRALHAYGAALADQYTKEGYNVQYIDNYQKYKELEYGTNGNLEKFEKYANDDLHMNGQGHYATAQFLMEDMGLYDVNSPACTIRHDSLNTWPLMPKADLDYGLTKKKTDNGEWVRASTDTGFVNDFYMASGNTDYKSMLLLGGAGTSGTHMSRTQFQDYSWLIDSFMRTDKGAWNKHLIKVADDSYDIEYFNSQFDALKNRYKPSFILYMPEINELYGDSYATTNHDTKVEVFGEALTTFADTCKESSIALTILTPFPMADPDKDKYLRDYVKKIEEVAETKSLSVSNLYNVFSTAMTDSPQIARNWYTADGYPDYIAQAEAAKVFLGGSVGWTSSEYLFTDAYSRRNTSANNGEQQDNFLLRTVRNENDSALILDLNPLLADSLYSGIISPSTANFAVTKTDASGTETTLSGLAYDTEKKVLNCSDAAITGGEKLTVTVKNGNLTTTLSPLTAADILHRKIEISSEKLTEGALTLDRLGLDYTTPESVTVALTNTGDAAVEHLTVKLSGDDAEKFVISSPGATTLQPGGGAADSAGGAEPGSTSFTIRPVIGLEIGAYQAEIVLEASGGYERSVPVTFTVVDTQKAQNGRDLAAAANTIQSGPWEVSMTEANAEKTLKAYVESAIKNMVTDAGIKTVVTTQATTPAAAGIYDNRGGTAGQYAFVVDLTKGTVTDDGKNDPNVDYRVTIQTKTVTVTISPAAFEADTELEGGLRIIPGHEQLTLRWTLPATNGVPVSSCALTVKNAQGVPLAGYEGLDAAGKSSLIVKGLTNGAVYQATLTVTYEDLLEPWTQTASGTPVESDPAPITILPTEEGEGTVKISLADGTAIEPSEIRTGMYVKLEAVPAQGMHFAYWERTAAVSPSGSLISGSFEEIEEGTRSTDNPMTVQAASAATYRAVFEATANTEAGAPKLSNLRILAPKNRELIRADRTMGFVSGETEYDVYFTEEEAKELRLELGVLSSGAAVTAATLPALAGPEAGTSGTAVYVDPISRVGTVSVTGLEDGETILAAVSQGGMNTTYRIHVNVVPNPQIVLELDASENRDEADLAVTVKNASFTTLTFLVKLDGDYLYATDNNYNQLPNEKDLAENLNMYYGLHESVKLVSLVSEGNGTFLSVTLEAADGKALITDEEPEPLIWFYLNKGEEGKKNSCGAEVLVEKGLMVETDAGAAARMWDIRFPELILKEEGTTSLLAKKAAELWEIGGVVHANAKPERVTYTVRNLNKDPDKQVREKEVPLTEDYLMLIKGPKSDYQFDVTAKGYLSLRREAKKVVANRYLLTMTLLAGDLNGDRVIDVNDRDLLLKALGKKPEPAEGFVEVSDGLETPIPVYGDFNDDGIIDALDLGNLLSNYGRDTKAEFGEKTDGNGGEQ